MDYTVRAPSQHLNTSFNGELDGGVLMLKYATERLDPANGYTWASENSYKLYMQAHSDVL